MNSLALVTGATGFVGRHVVRALQHRGFRIRPVIRSGRLQALPAGVNYESICQSPDIFGEPSEWWASACRDVDTVIHLAWCADPGHYLTSPKNRFCLMGTLALGSGALDAGVSRFVGIGSCSEYDVTQCLLSVTTPLKPTSLYAATKAAAFLTLSQMYADTSVKFAWCRLFYLFGEGEHPNRLVPYVRSRIAAKQQVELTRGNQIRDYIDVAEAAQQIADVAAGELTGPLNICSGRPVTVRQLVESIADETNDRHLLQFGLRRDNLLDPPCIVGVPSLHLPSLVAAQQKHFFQKPSAQ